MAEASYFRQELDKALQQGEGDGQKMTVDFEKEKKKLEGKLAEANKTVKNLSAENGNLMKALLCKEKLVQYLDKEKVELEAELSMLMSRLDSVEKESTFLKYEFQVMEKELEVRNGERNDIRSDGELESWKSKYGQMASIVAALKAQLNQLSEAENSMQLAISGFGLGKCDEFKQEKIKTKPEMQKFAVVTSTEGKKRAKEMKRQDVCSCGGNEVVVAYQRRKKGEKGGSHF
ncbi:Filament-like plant protein 5 [Bienertia sinuspersici]